uniref:Uncharacterized protein n=1 Tax=Rhinopithecus roxellana TaxID=61622 RepID=A0A2K6P720_RHIRO
VVQGACSRGGRVSVVPSSSVCLSTECIRAVLGVPGPPPALLICLGLKCCVFVSIVIHGPAVQAGSPAVLSCSPAPALSSCAPTPAGMTLLALPGATTALSVMSGSPKLPDWLPQLSDSPKQGLRDSTSKLRRYLVTGWHFPVSCLRKTGRQQEANSPGPDSWKHTGVGAQLGTGRKSKTRDWAKDPTGPCLIRSPEMCGS